MHRHSPSLTATGSISSLALCLHLCHTNGDPGASTFTLRVEVDEESRGRNGADGRKEKDKTLGPVPADVRGMFHPDILPPCVFPDPSTAVTSVRPSPFHRRLPVLLVSILHPTLRSSPRNLCGQALQPVPTAGRQLVGAPPQTPEALSLIMSHSQIYVVVIVVIN
ncbi:hypothetical protein C8J57DRAFT_1238914 [Mycena rebaudengoi]|nr:hypothetical protein C8J57DRAFT_1245856 [Mycena rebaudengoi]KAJ7251048.1 hypothetical protein C8J57DRAFT_1238914 [Mycena rebaudengoi]